MIGRRLTHIQTGQAVTVAGAKDGRWILQPEQFGPPFEVTPAELAAAYGTDPAATPSPADEPGWEALSRNNAHGARLIARGALPVLPTPEQRFRANEADRDA